MGARGPKPKPTHLKVLSGERESRINREEPMPAEGEVKPPAWIEGEALEVWDYYAQDLIDKGCLTKWDVDTFAVYCNAVAVHRDCARKMGDRYLDQGGAGGVIKSPYWQIQRDCAETIKKFSASFGFTPGDRANLRLDTQADGGPALGAERLLS